MLGTVKIKFKEGCYFNAWEGTKEVPILNKNEALPRGKMNYNVMKVSGLIFIKEKLYGQYVGDRDNLIKIKPFYGLMDNCLLYTSITVFPSDSKASISSLFSKLILCSANNSLVQR